MNFIMSYLALNNKITTQFVHFPDWRAPTPLPPAVLRRGRIGVCLIGLACKLPPIDAAEPVIKDCVMAVCFPLIEVGVIRGGLSGEWLDWMRCYWIILLLITIIGEGCTVTMLLYSK